MEMCLISMTESSTCKIQRYGHVYLWLLNISNADGSYTCNYVLDSEKQKKNLIKSIQFITDKYVVII